MMKTYLTKANETFADIAKKFQVKDEFHLKTFHNLNCSKVEIIHHEIPAGTHILLPADQQYLSEQTDVDAEGKLENVLESKNDTEKGQQNDEENLADGQKQNNEKEQKESSNSDHDGKYFVIQNGMCQCDKGFKFPKFKVTSHQKHYWNDAAGQSDYLAVTEEDLTLDPAAMPFGNCKLKPSSSGYLPCTYAPAGKWTKTYDKVKIMGKSCVTEISELMCAIGGKITILKHGQQSEIGKSNVKKADAWEQHVYNPIVNFEEYQEKVIGKEGEAW